MPDYRVEFGVPGYRNDVLFAVDIAGVENPQDARAIAIDKLKRKVKQPLPGVWLDIYEVPDEVLVFRGAARHQPTIGILTGFRGRYMLRQPGCMNSLLKYGAASNSRTV